MQRKEKDNRPLRRLVVYSLNGWGFPIHFLIYINILKLPTPKQGFAP